MACDICTTATSLFTVDTGAKQSKIRHELHSLKKGSCIPEAEKTEIMLTGLPPEFDAIVSSVSVSSKPVSFQKLVDALVGCENRQLRAVQKVALHANLVEGAPSQTLNGSVRGGRPPSGGRGRGFWPRVQCQICNRFGHLA
ncbi:hypothetical protein PVK06_003131 [Gossypium arboreum]|uniref:Uncharacterized protein n=1 Tax=Gossypium arboreum TaxID=29729 RepID=A0ABR0R6R6_GOSAR|nr:hypothetical protein PVK06_003131 [Gossypium arboreum]